MTDLTQRAESALADLKAFYMKTEPSAQAQFHTWLVGESSWAQKHPIWAQAGAAIAGAAIMRLMLHFF